MTERWLYDLAVRLAQPASLSIRTKVPQRTQKWPALLCRVLPCRSLQGSRRSQRRRAGSRKEVQWDNTYEIVLKDLASIDLPAQELQGNFFERKGERLLCIFILNDIWNLHAWIYSSKIRICKTLAAFFFYLNAKHFYSSPIHLTTHIIRTDFLNLIFEKIRWSFTFQRRRNSMAAHPLLREHGGTCVTSYSFRWSGFHNLPR